jgi:hypothetical protein
MAVFPGTYVPVNAHSNARVNGIVDNLLTPRMLAFRQVNVYDERAVLLADDKTWKVSYGNWNPTYQFRVHKGNVLYTNYVNPSYVNGTIEDNDPHSNDVLNITYNFDYFPVDVIAGFIYMSIDVINASAYGPPTSYTIADAPDYWDGVIADLAYAVAMERLILDYDLWYGRVIFAIGADQMEEGGGDIVSTLETLKSNAEERANRALENEKFKAGNYQSPPTSNYWRAIRGYGGYGRHVGSLSYGKLRGWTPTKWI